MGRTATATELPLADGDRMKAAEFFRRYKSDPDIVRAELINGVVFGLVRRGEPMPPISGGRHGLPQAYVLHWLGTYADATPGLDFAAPASVTLPTQMSVPEPDGILYRLPQVGGLLHLDESDYYHGVPDLIVEISNTTAAVDLGPKLEAYAAAGVPEYVVVRSSIGRVDWFTNRGDLFSPLKPGPDGWLRSRAFPGLWLDPAALIARDRPAIQAALRVGLASTGHAAFAAKLRKKLGPA